MRTNETDNGGCLPEMRRIRSKNFYSALVSNGKDGRVVVAIDDRHTVVELSSLATPVVELAEKLCKFVFVCRGSRRRSIPGPRLHEPLLKEAELVKAGDIGKLEA